MVHSQEGQSKPTEREELGIIRRNEICEVQMTCLSILKGPTLQKVDPFPPYLQKPKTLELIW